MNLTIFDSVQQSPSASLSIDPRSLYHAFEQVKDGRKARGKRYPLALIFTLLLLGKLAGETTIHGAIEWVGLRVDDLKKQFGHGGFPATRPTPDAWRTVTQKNWPA